MRIVEVLDYKMSSPVLKIRMRRIQSEIAIREHEIRALRILKISCVNEIRYRVTNYRMGVK